MKKTGSDDGHVVAMARLRLMANLFGVRFQRGRAFNFYEAGVQG